MNTRILHYQLCTMPNRKVLFNAVLQASSDTILAKCLLRVNSQRVDGWVIVLFLDQLISLPISPITCCAHGHLDRRNLSKGHKNNRLSCYCCTHDGRVQGAACIKREQVWGCGLPHGHIPSHVLCKE